MPSYRERLGPGLGTILACLLLAPASLLVGLPISSPAGVVDAIVVAGVIAVVLTGGTIGGLFALAPVIEVADGELRAGRAHIGAGLVGRTEVFRGQDATSARGRDLDARAYTVLRGWVGPVLRIWLDDPADPAPYWVVSTRRPEQLASAIADATAARR